MYLRSATSILALSFFLAGCSNFSPNMRDIYKTNHVRKAEASKLIAKAEHPLPQADMSSLQVNDDVFIGAHVTKQSSSASLPEVMEHEGVTLMSANPLSLEGIGLMITDATGLAVSFSEDIQKASYFNVQDGDGMNHSMSYSSSSSNKASVERQEFLRAMQRPKMKTGQMRVNYNGPLSIFLDHVAGFYNIGWNYEDGTIHFFRNTTQTFVISAMPSTVTSTSSMSSGVMGSGGSGVTGAQVSANIKVEVDFWKDLQDTVQSIVQKEASFKINKSAGTITVSGPYDLVSRVGEYVNELNTELLRQVMIKVEVFTVSLNTQSLMKFAPEMLFSAGKNMLGFGGLGALPTLNPSALLTAANSAAGSPINITTVSPNSKLGSGLSFGQLTGNFKGSNAFIQLGDSLGSTSILTSTAVTTMSGQPIPVQVGNTRGYVSQVQTVVSQTTSTTSVSTSNISSGFSIDLLPRVMDDGEVLLQYAMNISSLVGNNDGFDTFNVSSSSGTTSMQLLNVDQRSFIQQALINNGATLVLAGFESEQSSGTDQGSGSPAFKLLGGSYSGTKTREMLVISITPIVLEHKETARSIASTLKARGS